MIREVKQLCSQRGLRLTPIRQQVLELILTADGPVKAYELLERLGGMDGKFSNAPPTVYRALEFLLENHFIHRLESINAFVSCLHPQRLHSGEFLICQQCDNVIELHDDKIASMLHSAADQHQFNANKQVVEIYGICVDCHSS